MSENHTEIKQIDRAIAKKKKAISQMEIERANRVKLNRSWRNNNTWK